MSLWEFGFIQQGFSKFHSGEGESTEAPSMEEHEEMVRRFGDMDALIAKATESAE